MHTIFRKIKEKIKARRQTRYQQQRETIEELLRDMAAYYATRHPPDSPAYRAGEDEDNDNTIFLCL